MRGSARTLVKKPLTVPLPFCRQLVAGERRLALGHVATVEGRSASEDLESEGKAKAEQRQEAKEADRRLRGLFSPAESKVLSLYRRATPDRPRRTGVPRTSAGSGASVAQESRESVQRTRRAAWATPYHVQSPVLERRDQLQSAWEVKISARRAESRLAKVDECLLSQHRLARSARSDTYQVFVHGTWSYELLGASDRAGGLWRENAASTARWRSLRRASARRQVVGDGAGRGCTRRASATRVALSLRALRAGASKCQQPWSAVFSRTRASTNVAAESCTARPPRRFISALLDVCLH